MSPLDPHRPTPVPPVQRPLRVEYATPGRRSRHPSGLRLAVVTVTVTVGAVTALSAALFALGLAAWGVGRMVRGIP